MEQQRESKTDQAGKREAPREKGRGGEESKLLQTIRDAKLENRGFGT